MTIDVAGVALSQKYIVAVLLGVAIYNSLEILPAVYFTFPKYSGLYFWSVMTSNFGVLVYSTGFVLNNFQLTGNQTLPTIMTVAGWIPMVSAQSLVLYSRLHLVNLNARIRRRVLIMIAVNGVTLHISTLITTAGSNSRWAELFLFPYAVLERIQVTVFFAQELILSSLYVWKAREFLHSCRRRKEKNNQVQKKLRAMMIHLILTNLVLVALEIGIVVLEFAGLYFIQVSYKAFVYSAKLKCEIGILNRLVDFVKTAAGPYRNAGRHNWPGPHDGHKCCVHGCEVVNGGGRGGRGHHGDDDFQLSSQIEREWEATLRNTFGVALSEGGRDSDEKREEGGDMSRQASTSTARPRSEPEQKPSVEDLGHPGERVLGLFTITSGDGSRARNSIEGGTWSSSNAATYSSSWEPHTSTPPVPERSYLR